MASVPDPQRTIFAKQHQSWEEVITCPLFSICILFIKCVQYSPPPTPTVHSWGGGETSCIPSSPGVSNWRPWTGCGTLRPRPPQLRGGGKHCDTSPDGNVTCRVWHPCSSPLPIYGERLLATTFCIARKLCNFLITNYIFSWLYKILLLANGMTGRAKDPSGKHLELVS